MIINVRLNKKEEALRKSFLDRKTKEVLDYQKDHIDEYDNFAQALIKNNMIYTGAIGGEYSYIITETSVGCIVIIKYNVNGFEEEVNITDFDAW